jgi:hypothetical protein
VWDARGQGRDEAAGEAELGHRRGDHAVARGGAGISFLCIDLASPGITVRPIIAIDGQPHLHGIFAALQKMDAMHDGASMTRESFKQLHPRLDLATPLRKEA